MTCGRVLERCIFCDSTDMTEEHIVADWVLRAFMRTKKPDPGFAGTFVDEHEIVVSPGEAISTAKVVCRMCNNEWLSRIDEDAADALKPLVRGRSVAELQPGAQTAVAAWMFKCALIFDALQGADGGPLTSLRTGFAESRQAPPGCAIFVGPGSYAPFHLEAVPEVAGLAFFGVREIAGRFNLTANVRGADGTVTKFPTRSIPIPGYAVMLGNFQGIISGRRAPIMPAPEQGFARIWPTSERPVSVTSTRPPTFGRATA
jgi:hypothetical protein